MLINSALSVQGSAKWQSPALVDFVTALSYYLCLAFPAVFTQPEDYILAKHCSSDMDFPLRPKTTHVGEAHICFCFPFVVG